MSSGAVLFIVILAAAVLGAWILYAKVKRKAEQFSMAAFGTKDLLEGYRRQEDELAETPKSVSAMTRIFAPQIAKDFPEFQVDRFKAKAENLLVAALRAVSAGNTALLGECDGELRRQVENQIGGNRAAGIREVYEQITVYRTEISNYQKKDGKCIITFQSAVGHTHYREKDGQVIWGDMERRQQTKYNTELVYVQDPTRMGAGNAVGLTCPNCGAPVTGLGALRCEYCGTAVTPVNEKVWVMHQYYEVDYNHA